MTICTLRILTSVKTQSIGCWITPQTTLCISHWEAKLQGAQAGAPRWWTEKIELLTGYLMMHFSQKEHDHVGSQVHVIWPTAETIHNVWKRPFSPDNTPCHDAFFGGEVKDPIELTQKPVFKQDWSVLTQQNKETNLLFQFQSKWVCSRSLRQCFHFLHHLSLLSTKT